jgi:hypothetical protein
MLLFCTVFILSTVASTLLELAFRFDRPGRTGLFIVLAGFTTVLFAWHIARPLLRSLGILRSEDNSTLATRIGTHFPQIHDRLLNLLQLHQESTTGKSLYSPELVDASFEDLAVEIRGLDFTILVDGSPIKRLTRLLGVSLLGAFLLVVAAPGQFYDSLFRVTHFNRDFVSPPEFMFDISPSKVSPCTSLFASGPLRSRR